MKQKHVALSFGLAAITAICLAVIVPLQSYLCNKSLYDFSLQEFLVESFVIALGITIFCGVILLASEFLTGRLLHVLCVAFLVDFDAQSLENLCQHFVLLASRQTLFNGIFQLVCGFDRFGISCHNDVIGNEMGIL